MADEKDRFGETMKLVERAKEDLYFAQRDRELLEKLKLQLRRVEDQKPKLQCPKCGGTWESYTFQGIALDRCQQCGGVWMDKGELDAVLRKFSRSPFDRLIDQLIGRKEQGTEKAAAKGQS